MRRKEFIKYTTLFGLACTLFPQLAWAKNSASDTADLLMGKGSPKLFGKDYQLLKEVHEAFEAMKAEAKHSGLDLYPVSSYRSFYRQKQIWERKYKQFTQEGLTPENTIKKIIEYSTIPGTSRHHWGTDFDLIDLAVQQPKSVLEVEHYQENGAFCDLKVWLNEHAEKFHFYEVYTSAPSRKGFHYEPWHFSYAPLSKKMLKDFLEIDVFSILESENLVGADYFSESFVEKYINEHLLDIHPALLP